MMIRIKPIDLLSYVLENIEILLISWHGIYIRSKRAAYVLKHIAWYWRVQMFRFCQISINSDIVEQQYFLVFFIHKLVRSVEDKKSAENLIKSMKGRARTASNIYVKWWMKGVHWQIHVLWYLPCMFRLSPLLSDDKQQAIWSQIYCLFDISEKNPAGLMWISWLGQSITSALSS